MPATSEPLALVAADGVTLAARRWRGVRPRGGTVILLHGGGQTGHAWAHTGQRLAARGWDAVALDARGHGESGWSPAGSYALDDHVADIVSVVEQLAVAPAVLVGASLGAATSLLAVDERSDIASALVLVDMVAEPDPAGLDRIYAFMSAHADGFGSLEEAREAVAAYSAHRTRPASLDGLRKNLRPRVDGRWYWHWDPAVLRMTDREGGRDRALRRIRDACGSVTIPTLLIRGQRSDVVSSAGLAAMHELLPHAEVADVSGAGHMVAGDDNDVFGDVLLDFLSRLVPAHLLDEAVGG